MDNKEIAAIFDLIADALEIKGENVFKIRAYRRAARNISNLPEQASSISSKDPSQLDSIPGIGKDLKEKIIEMATSGRLAYFDALMKDFPPGFLDMLKLSGLGPKKLKKLKEELNILNMDDLEKACREHLLSKMEGMGEKTEQKLSDAIKYYRKREGRLLLPEAARAAEKKVDYLEKSGLFEKIEIAGSLRRGKETIGDIDILATAKDKIKAMDYFTAAPDVEKIITKGAVKSSVLLKGGSQIDLRFASGECFGAALMYFTGSKEHNIELRRRAKKKGIKLMNTVFFQFPSRARKKNSREKRKRKFTGNWA